MGFFVLVLFSGALVVNVVDSFCPLQQQQKLQHGRTSTSSKSSRRTTMLFSSNMKQSWDRTSSSSSYSNNWLSFFHNQRQEEMQLTTNSLSIWKEEQQREQEKIREWQDSFHRNGLSDFCPPMSAGLQCLMIGGGVGSSDSDDSMLSSSSSTRSRNAPIKLPWEVEPQADITSLQVVVQNDDNYNGVVMVDTTNAVIEDVDDDVTAVAAAPMVRTTLVASSSSSKQQQQQSQSSGVPMFKTNKEAAVYDCIIDHGLLQAVMSVQQEQQRTGVDNDDNQHHQQQNQQADAAAVAVVGELLFEAATALKEHGIYVLVTPFTLSCHTRQLLQSVSVHAGLEWAFELDGISDPLQHQVVSVARRFNTGHMPKVGKLSRFHPR